ncbi:hypothetical protein [Streptomyces sp. NPDC056707]|uniref:hypothetical protein n=1 Tax=Streptomyces sp. NPDC056707 TaxID=3345919 RepID=UPI0036B66AB4
MIENTNSTSARAALLLGALAGLSADQLIGAQEGRGQQQLVHSDRLPTQMDDDQAAFEAVGFRFGDPDPTDPMFMLANLPTGWSREAADHDMWSYVIDEQGRRRVAVFYKAAFYDRSAFMRLITVSSYLWDHVHDGTPLITDDSWATPAAIAEACRSAMKNAQDQIDTWTTHDKPEYVTKYTAERDQYAAVLAQHDIAQH